ncbi:MAG: hypothetical protein OXJ55_04905, partial [Caldilineaceae bacterium]|nr:hypothetical protein [Caldilineaceae bacterium]
MHVGTIEATEQLRGDAAHTNPTCRNLRKWLPRYFVAPPGTVGGSPRFPERASASKCAQFLLPLMPQSLTIATKYVISINYECFL